MGTRKQAKQQWIAIATQAPLNMSIEDADRLCFLSLRLLNYDLIRCNDRSLTEAEERLEQKYIDETKHLMDKYGIAAGYRKADLWWEFNDPRGDAGITIGFPGVRANNMGGDSWHIGKR